MTEYIEREALLKEVYKIGGRPWSEWETAGVESLIHRQPAADVVAVVRCKDCKHRGDENSCPMCKCNCCNDGDGYYDVWTDDLTHDNDFCSLGERRV